MHGVQNFPLGTDWVNYLFHLATQLQVNAEPKNGLFNFPNASDNEVKTCHSTTAVGQIWPKNISFKTFVCLLKILFLLAGGQSWAKKFPFKLI